MKKISILISIIVIIAAVILVGGVFAYQYFMEIWNYYPNEVAKSRVQNETVGWKTYTNTQYGFEFQYPATWKLEQSDLFTTIKSPDFQSSYYESGAEFLTAGSEIRILNSNLGEFSSVQEYIKSQEEIGFILSEKKEIKTGNIDGIEYYWGHEGPVELFVNFIKDDYLHQITFVSAGEERGDRDYSNFIKVLSTFKLIK